MPCPDFAKGGGDSNASFEAHRKRLAYLERWREFAVRPNRDECAEGDFDLFSRSDDDLEALDERCLEARCAANKHLPSHYTAFDGDLAPAISSIAGAGNGLFYEPRSPSGIIRQGEVACYYYGNIHNFHSARYIEDGSYLLLVAGDMFVDPGPLLHVKARYINDPCNDDFYNCRYEPQPESYRSAVIATRDIRAGEELLASYGELYWSQHHQSATILTKSAKLAHERYLDSIVWRSG